MRRPKIDTIGNDKAEKLLASPHGFRLQDGRNRELEENQSVTDQERLAWYACWSIIVTYTTIPCGDPHEELHEHLFIQENVTPCHFAHACQTVLHDTHDRAIGLGCDDVLVDHHQLSDLSMHKEDDSGSTKRQA